MRKVSLAVMAMGILVGMFSVWGWWRNTERVYYEENYGISDVNINEFVSTDFCGGERFDLGESILCVDDKQKAWVDRYSFWKFENLEWKEVEGKVAVSDYKLNNEIYISWYTNYYDPEIWVLDLEKRIAERLFDKTDLTAKGVWNFYQDSLFSPDKKFMLFDVRDCWQCDPGPSQLHVMNMVTKKLIFVGQGVPSGWLSNTKLKWAPEIYVEVNTQTDGVPDFPVKPKFLPEKIYNLD